MTGDNKMVANDLHELLEKSSSTREYFLNLPVDLQLQLHACNDFIQTSQKLHLIANVLSKRKSL